MVISHHPSWSPCPLKYWNHYGSEDQSHCHVWYIAQQQSQSDLLKKDNDGDLDDDGDGADDGDGVDGDGQPWVVRVMMMLMMWMAMLMVMVV